MISFLIPIYNRNVTEFVGTLFEQCQMLQVPFEILCYDDQSEEAFKEINRSLSEKMGVSYMELSRNLGRSKIRNWLGKNARYENLVFMDCDSKIVHENFAVNYVQSVNQADVVYGGTSYQTSKPAENKRLHWNYGRKVEAQTITRRKRSPFESFRSNNFMISRSVFIENLFDESVQGYGYEDMLFARKLKEQEYSIAHIDNPLIHDGLETNEVFLKKTEKAIGNLARLYKHERLETRLTKKYRNWKENGILKVFVLHSQIFGKNRFEHLIKNKSGLLSFQLYKMDLFNKMMNRED